MKKVDIKDFLNELHSILDEVTQRLNDRRNGVSGVGEIYELERIQKELSELEAAIRAGNIPPKDHRTLAAGRIVTDTWPLNDRLGGRICELEDTFKRRID